MLIEQNQSHSRRMRKYLLLPVSVHLGKARNLEHGDTDV